MPTTWPSQFATASRLGLSKLTVWKGMANITRVRIRTESLLPHAG